MAETRSRVKQIISELNSMPENSDEDEVIPPRTHATRSRVKVVDDIPLPQTVCQQCFPARSAPGAHHGEVSQHWLGAQDGPSREVPAPHEQLDAPAPKPSHLARKGVGPLGRKIKKKATNKEVAPTPVNTASAFRVSISNAGATSAPSDSQ